MERRPSDLPRMRPADAGPVPVAPGEVDTQDDEPYLPEAYVPEAYVPEADVANDYEDEGLYEPPPRGGKLKWLLLLAMLIAAGVYGVKRVVSPQYADQWQRTFQDVSLLPSDPLKVTAADLQLQVYYPAHNLTLVPYRLKLARTAAVSERLTLICDALQKAPPGGLLESPLPSGCKLRGIYLLDNVAWVDVSAEFLKPQQSTPPQQRLMVYSLVNSLKLNAPSIAGVRFMVNGRALTSAWDWMDLSTPLGPDLSLIQ